MRSQKICSTQSTAVGGARTEEEREVAGSGSIHQIYWARFLFSELHTELYYRLYLVCSNSDSGYDTANKKIIINRSKAGHWCLCKPPILPLPKFFC